MKRRKNGDAKRIDGKGTRTTNDRLAAENERLRRAVARLKVKVEGLEAARGPQQQLTIAGANSLTTREREVLECFLIRKDDKLVAASLGVKNQTVHNHMAAVLAKLGVPSRAHLIAAFCTDQKSQTG